MSVREQVSKRNRGVLRRRGLRPRRRDTPKRSFQVAFNRAREVRALNQCSNTGAIVWTVRERPPETDGLARDNTEHEDGSPLQALPRQMPCGIDQDFECAEIPTVHAVAQLVEGERLRTISKLKPLSDSFASLQELCGTV